MKVLIQSVIIVALWSTVQWSVAATVQNAAPVPDLWLKGQNLQVQELNFSLRSPTPNTRWYSKRLADVEGSRATAFFAEDNSETTILGLVVWEKTTFGRLDSKEEKKFIESMSKTLPKNYRISSYEIQASAIPTVNSSRFIARIESLLSPRQYAFGYISPGTMTYVFSVY